MNNFIFINNFKATLVSALNNTSTNNISIQVTSPSTTEMQNYLFTESWDVIKFLPLVIINSANSTVYEIIYVTTLSYVNSNIYTINCIRGRENTTAQIWSPTTSYIICSVTAYLLMGYNTLLNNIIEPSPLKSVHSIELQTSRSSNDRTALKPGSVIIGANNKLNSENSICIGFNNTYNDTFQYNNPYNNLIIGHDNIMAENTNNTTACNNSVIIGANNKLNGADDSIIFGFNNTLQNSGGNLIIGENNYIINTESKANTVIIGRNFNTTIPGGGSTNNYNYNYLIGENNKIIVPGTLNNTINYTTLVLGKNCTVAKGSILLGSENDILGVAHSISFGNRVGIVDYMGGTIWTMRSNPFEIGGAAPTYANNTTYYYGDIVRHPTDANKYCQLTNLTIDPNSGTYPSYSRSSYIAADWTEFPKAPPTNYTWFTVQYGMIFAPTDLYILIWRFSTLSGSPSISIGTASNPGAILNNYTFVPTSSTAYYIIPLPSPTNYIQGPETVILRVNTLSTNGRALCVALLSGYFVLAPEVPGS